MSIGLLDHVSLVEDHRVPGMVTHPLDEVLSTTLVGLPCRAEDFDETELIGIEQLEWLRRFPPFEHGIPQTRTFSRIFRLLDPAHLEAAFSSWSTVCASTSAAALLDRLTHHCEIVETGNESWRFKNRA